MEFRLGLESMTPSPNFSLPPLSYHLDTVKSLKEDRIKLTAPLFCQLIPHVSSFKSVNTTIIKGTMSNQVIVVENLMLSIIEESPMIQITQIV
jgi:hypothetical protein